jgi:hypothetical protein
VHSCPVQQADDDSIHAPSTQARRRRVAANFVEMHKQMKHLRAFVGREFHESEILGRSSSPPACAFLIIAARPTSPRPNQEILDLASDAVDQEPPRRWSDHRAKSDDDPLGHHGCRESVTSSFVLASDTVPGFQSQQRNSVLHSSQTDLARGNTEREPWS